MTEIALAVARSEPAGVGLDSMGRPCVRSIKSLWWGIEPHVTATASASASASPPNAAVRHALGETEGMDEYVNRWRGVMMLRPFQWSRRSDRDARMRPPLDTQKQERSRTSFLTIASSRCSTGSLGRHADRAPSRKLAFVRRRRSVRRRQQTST
jgi:hypothetical protein